MFKHVQQSRDVIGRWASYERLRGPALVPFCSCWPKSERGEKTRGDRSPKLALKSHKYWKGSPSVLAHSWPSKPLQLSYATGHSQQLCGPSISTIRWLRILTIVMANTACTCTFWWVQEHTKRESERETRLHMCEEVNWKVDPTPAQRPLLLSTRKVFLSNSTNCLHVSSWYKVPL